MAMGMSVEDATAEEDEVAEGRGMGMVQGRRLRSLSLVEGGVVERDCWVSDAAELALTTGLEVERSGSVCALLTP